MAQGQSERPATLYLLLLGMLFQGLSGTAGGIGLVTDPTGARLTFSTEMLAGSPFEDFLIPGLFLTFALGIAPLIVAAGLGLGRGWAWAASLLVSLALLAWIVVEVLVVGVMWEPPLQQIYGGLGLLLLALTLSPSVRAHSRL